MVPAMDRPDPRHMPEPMHPVGQSVEDEQEDYELKSERQRPPMPVGVMRKWDSTRHLCGKNKEDLIRREGRYILRKYLAIRELTRGPPIFCREKEQADSPIDGDPFPRKRISKRVEHRDNLGHISPKDDRERQDKRIA